MSEGGQAWFGNTKAVVPAKRPAEGAAPSIGLSTWAALSSLNVAFDLSAECSTCGDVPACVSGAGGLRELRGLGHLADPALERELDREVGVIAACGGRWSVALEHLDEALDQSGIQVAPGDAA